MRESKSLLNFSKINIFRWIVQGTPKPVITGELWRVVSDWIHPEEEMVAYRSVSVVTYEQKHKQTKNKQKT